MTMIPHLIDESISDSIHQLFTGSISLLFIEDDPQMSDLLCDEFFRSTLFTKTKVDTFGKAKSAIQSKSLYHCWILDLTLEEHNDGMKLLKYNPAFPYCVVTSSSISLYDATCAIRKGAFGAYDKNTVIAGNTDEYIKEICALSSLSFLLHAQKPERFEMFTLLLDHFICTQEEWSRIYCRNERSVRNICEEYSGLTARQFLYLFHVLTATLYSDCIMEDTVDSGDIPVHLNEQKRLYRECASYVLSRFDRVYKPKLL